MVFNYLFSTHPFASAMLFPSLCKERGEVRKRTWGESSKKNTTINCSYYLQIKTKTKIILLGMKSNINGLKFQI